MSEPQQTTKVPETTAEEAVPSPPTADAAPTEAAASADAAPAASAIPNTLPGQYWVQVRFPSDRVMSTAWATALINPKYSNKT